ncbi:LOW QUALITY PROTEIN: hypothetical protein PHMEG_00033177 [Phytophthora megakarya]|uniref:Uncharacterized protein n=1 Tax=Phytophthora megakarya TaxID=4795 RepID=A0A225UTT3_9STRA|nr:LOW QUALITY PROTEIN: hypothetical protein PHMEG_00033177 [Phytophthora megakarya]
MDACDDRGLEERLCPVRVRDIHDLETMINDILRRRERHLENRRHGSRIAERTLAGATMNGPKIRGVVIAAIGVVMTSAAVMNNLTDRE